MEYIPIVKVSDITVRDLRIYPQAHSWFQHLITSLFRINIAQEITLSLYFTISQDGGGDSCFVVGDNALYEDGSLWHIIDVQGNKITAEILSPISLATPFIIISGRYLSLHSRTFKEGK